MKLNRENKILAGLVVAALILIGKLFVIQIVDSSYNALKALARKAKERKSMVMDKMYGSVWYVPGGKSTIGSVMADANIDYVFADNGSAGSVAMAFEAVLDKGGEADLWAMRYGGRAGATYKSLLDENKGYGQMARLVGDGPEAQWAAATAQRTREAFHKKYWNGSYYVSPGYKGQPDDRAQALAVVSGTLPEELYPTLRPFFRQQYHASPYMEKYVLQALCRMGYHQDALDRMKLRYAAMTDSPLTTLWEGWGIGDEGFGGGSYNHAWSGGPLTIMSQYIAGIETTRPGFAAFDVRPHPAHLSHIRTVVPLSGGREIRFALERDAGQCCIRLEVPEGSEARFFAPEPYSRIWINGEERPLEADGTVLPAGKWEITLQ